MKAHDPKDQKVYKIHYTSSVVWNVADTALWHIITLSCCTVVTLYDIHMIHYFVFGILAMLDLTCIWIQYNKGFIINIHQFIVVFFWYSTLILLVACKPHTWKKNLVNLMHLSPRIIAIDSIHAPWFAHITLFNYLLHINSV